MNEDITRALCERLIAEGYAPYDYSGRAMYGSRCPAVDLNSSADLFKLGIDIMRSADGADLLYSTGDDLLNVYTDSMGYGIVAYWRWLRWPEGYCPPTTMERLREQLDEDYGQDGLNALELCCITSVDLEQGYDHCMEKVGAAMEESMS